MAPHRRRRRCCSRLPLLLAYGLPVASAGGVKGCQLRKEPSLDAARFAAEFQGRAPVVLPGAAAAWAGEAWAREPFVSRFGNRTTRMRTPEVLRADGAGQRLSPAMVTTVTVEEYVAGMNASESFIFENAHSPLARALGRELDARAMPTAAVRLYPLVSVGGRGRGIGPHHHKESWLAQLSGRKYWVTADGRGPPPDVGDGACSWKPNAKQKGVKACVTAPGDVLYLPSGWWHATCNLDDWVVGFGGQEDAGLAAGSPHLAALDSDEAALRAMAPEALSRATEDAMQATPSHFAAMAGHVAALKLLHELGADVTKESERLGAPVFEAVAWDQPEVLDWFLEAKLASAASRHPTGLSLLHLGASSGHATLVPRLLAIPGLDPSLPDTSGHTALHHAAVRGFEDVARALLRGAGPRLRLDAQDAKYGKTAEEWATKKGFERIAALLREHRDEL